TLINHLPSLTYTYRQKSTALLSTPTHRNQPPSLTYVHTHTHTHTHIHTHTQTHTHTVTHAHTFTHTDTHTQTSQVLNHFLLEREKQNVEMKKKASINPCE